MQNKSISLLSFILFVSLSVLPLKSESGYTIFGQIIDKDYKQPIPGATIKVAGTKKGSYSSTRGKFRIPFLEGKNRLKIMSIGYKTRFIEVDENSDSLIVKLSPSPVLLKEAKVSTTPGIAFGPTGESHLRLSFCVPEEQINKAFDRMEEYFK